MTNLPYWEDLYRQIALFPQGIVLIPPASQAFKEEEQFYRLKEEEVIWMSEEYVLVKLYHAQVTGLHLVIHARKKYWEKQGAFHGWEYPLSPKQAVEHIRGFLEIMCIALMLEKLLVASRLFPIFNPEIHFSGNWGVKREDLLEQHVEMHEREMWFEHIKGEQYKEKLWGGAWHISNHCHIYATNSPESYVTLPDRPYRENPKTWPANQTLSLLQLKHMQNLISEKLAVSLVSLAGYLTDSS